VAGPFRECVLAIPRCPLDVTTKAFDSYVSRNVFAWLTHRCLQLLTITRVAPCFPNNRPEPLGAVDERVVEDQLCALVGELGLPPQLHLALQRFKVPLNPVNADRKRVNQIEALGVFGKHRGEVAANGQDDGYRANRKLASKGESGAPK